MKTYKMRQYYVAYDFGQEEVECIDGPFVTYIDASDARMDLIVGYEDDEKLIIVCKALEVYEV